MSGMQLRRVVSGGQTGADQGGLTAARAFGIETGGWAPKGWLTEDGPAPWLADLGLVQCQKPCYPARTRANVRDSHATLWFGAANSPGFWATRTAALNYSRPFLVVEPGARPSEVVAWLAAQAPPVEVLNVAGNRESRDPGIGDRTGAFLIRMFRLMAKERGEPHRGD